MIHLSTDIRSALRARQRGFLLNPYRFGPPKDPNYSSVSLLLHMDGTDGSTSFTDNSPSPRTMTVGGNAQVDTAQSKFGGASLLLDGSGDYLTTPANAVFNLGSGAFTIEGWIRFASGGVRGVIVGQADAGGADASLSFYVERTASNQIRGVCFASGTPFGSVTGTTTLAVDTWYHFAYVRSGNNFNIYLNGVSDASTVTSSSSVSSSAYNLSVGRLGAFNGLYLNGWLDDLRITKGVARYTGTFPVPTAAFPNQ